MNATVATWAGRILALAIFVVGPAAVAVTAGFDPTPIVDAVTRIAN